MKRGNANIYKRFIFSFLVVLILPTILFVILLFDDFKEIYQDKIVKQAQKSLEVSVLELERNIENFNAIVSYNTFLPQMQDYVIKNDVLGDDVEAMDLLWSLTGNIR